MDIEKLPYYSTWPKWSFVYLTCWGIGFVWLLLLFLLFSADTVAFYMMSVVFFGFSAFAAYALGTRPRALLIYPSCVIIRKYFGQDVVIPLDAIISVRLLRFVIVPRTCGGDFTTSFTECVQLSTNTTCGSFLISPADPTFFLRRLQEVMERQSLPGATIL